MIIDAYRVLDMDRRQLAAAVIHMIQRNLKTGFSDLAF